MKILYDEDGNKVEVPDDNEVTELKAKAEKAAELEQQALEAQKKIEEYESKESKKKYDFANLRRKLEEKDEIIESMKKEGVSEADKKVLEEKLKEAEDTIKKYTEVEQTLANELKIREDREKQKLSSYKEGKFESIKDEELRKKVQAEYDLINIDEMSEDSVEERFSRAYMLATGNRPSSTKPTISVGGRYTPEDHAEKDFVKTDKGKAAYKEVLAKAGLSKEQIEEITK